MKTLKFRLISLIVLFFFSFNLISYGSGLQEYPGDITGLYRGNAGEVIIIRDAHSSYTAQKNIAEIIVNLTARGDVSSVVGIEGAAGCIDLSILSGYPSLQAKDIVTDILLEDGELTGAEKAAIVSGREIVLAGLEDADLYVRNYDIYVNSREDRKRGVENISEIDAGLERLKKRVYNKKLLDLDKLFYAYRNGKVSTLSFCSKVSVAAFNFGVDTEKYTYFTLFRELALLRSKFDFEDIRRLKKLLFEKLELSGNIVRGSLKPEVGLEYILCKAEEAGILSEEFLPLKAYSEYMRKRNLFDAGLFLNEVEKLVLDIEYAVSVNDEERRIIKYSYLISLLRKIIALEGSYEEVSSFFGKKNAIFGIESFLAEYGLGDIDGVKRVIPDIEEFYRLADRRSSAMVDNLLRSGRDGKSKIVVAGGYHTDKITEILREKGVSYRVITPSVFKDDIALPYEEIMLGRFVPFAPSLNTLQKVLRTGVLLLRDTGLIRKWGFTDESEYLDDFYRYVFERFLAADFMIKLELEIVNGADIEEAVDKAVSHIVSEYDAVRSVVKNDKFVNLDRDAFSKFLLSPKLKDLLSEVVSIEKKSKNVRRIPESKKELIRNVAEAFDMIPAVNKLPEKIDVIRRNISAFYSDFCFKDDIRLGLFPPIVVSESVAEESVIGELSPENMEYRVNEMAFLILRWAEGGKLYDNLLKFLDYAKGDYKAVVLANKGLARAYMFGGNRNVWRGINIKKYGVNLQNGISMLSGELKNILRFALDGRMPMGDSLIPYSLIVRLSNGGYIDIGNVKIIDKVASRKSYLDELLSKESGAKEILGERIFGMKEELRHVKYELYEVNRSLSSFPMRIFGCIFFFKKKMYLKRRAELEEEISVWESRINDEGLKLKDVEKRYCRLKDECDRCSAFLGSWHKYGELYIKITDKGKSLLERNERDEKESLRKIGEYASLMYETEVYNYSRSERIRLGRVVSDSVISANAVKIKNYLAGKENEEFGELFGRAIAVFEKFLAFDDVVNNTWRGRIAGYVKEDILFNFSVDVAIHFKDVDPDYIVNNVIEAFSESLYIPVEKDILGHDVTLKRLVNYDNIFRGISSLFIFAEENRHRYDLTELIDKAIDIMRGIAYSKVNLVGIHDRDLKVEDRLDSTTLFLSAVEVLKYVRENDISDIKGVIGEIVDLFEALHFVRTDFTYISGKRKKLWNFVKSKQIFLGALKLALYMRDSGIYDNKIILKDVGDIFSKLKSAKTGYTGYRGESKPLEDYVYDEILFLQSVSLTIYKKMRIITDVDGITSDLGRFYTAVGEVVVPETSYFRTRSMLDFVGNSGVAAILLPAYFGILSDEFRQVFEKVGSGGNYLYDMKWRYGGCESHAYGESDSSFSDFVGAFLITFVTGNPWFAMFYGAFSLSSVAGAFLGDIMGDDADYGSVSGGDIDLVDGGYESDLDGILDSSIENDFDSDLGGGLDADLGDVFGTDLGVGLDTDLGGGFDTDLGGVFDTDLGGGFDTDLGGGFDGGGFDGGFGDFKGGEDIADEDIADIVAKNDIYKLSDGRLFEKIYEIGTNIAHNKKLIEALIKLGFSDDEISKLVVLLSGGVVEDKYGNYVRAKDVVYLAETDSLFLSEDLASNPKKYAYGGVLKKSTLSKNGELLPAGSVLIGGEYIRNKSIPDDVKTALIVHELVHLVADGEDKAEAVERVVFAGRGIERWELFYPSKLDILNGKLVIGHLFSEAGLYANELIYGGKDNYESFLESLILSKRSEPDRAVVVGDEFLLRSDFHRNGKYVLEGLLQNPKNRLIVAVSKENYDKVKELLPYGKVIFGGIDDAVNTALLNMKILPENIVVLSHPKELAEVKEGHVNVISFDYGELKKEGDLRGVFFFDILTAAFIMAKNGGIVPPGLDSVIKRDGDMYMLNLKLINETISKALAEYKLSKVTAVAA